MKYVRRAFTLGELLVCIGIIGMVLGLFVGAVQNIRAAAARARCLNTMKQIGLALHHYHDVHGRIPPASARGKPIEDPTYRLSWMVLILPELEQESLYRQSIQAGGNDANPLHNPPHVGLATVVGAYVCPVDARQSELHVDSYLKVPVAYTSYVGIAGTMPSGAKRGFRGVFGSQPGARLTDFTDGTSTTLMVGERPPPDTWQAGFWYPKAWFYPFGRGPNNLMILGSPKASTDDDSCYVSRAFGPGRLDNPCDRLHLWSLHPRGANFLFADGSVHFMTYAAEPVIWALGSRDGGEVVGAVD